MISAKVVCDSISEAGVRLTTFEIEVPRIVWSEFMTHRMFSRNASSSRAIPFSKMAEQLDGIPVRFGKNVAGMADGGEHDTLINDLYTPEEWWHLAKLSATNFSRGYADAGYHKQISGRLTEAFQCIKAVVSATEFDNFFFLRNDSAADPTIAELARCMQEAREESEPQLLKAGWYHLPYVSFMKDFDGRPMFYLAKDDGVLDQWLTLEEAIKVSCARCAAVSYRNEGYGLEKSLQLYERLVGAEKKHASALEHCCTPMQETIYYTDYGVNDPQFPQTWQEGVSHADRKGNLWSGNFSGYIQHRKTIAGENHEG